MPDLRVRIKYLSSLRDTTGQHMEHATLSDGSTLREAALWLKERHELTVPSPRVMAVLNGTGWNQLPQGLATELHDGDEIALFPPIAGG
jgi:MoaD family protein